MTSLLAWWSQLVESFGEFGAAMALIYAGGIIALLIAIVRRVLLQVIRRRRVGRELRLVRDAAYRERPSPRGPYAA